MNIDLQPIAKNRNAPLYGGCTLLILVRVNLTNNAEKCVTS
jgi:hypothetical protein